MELRIPILPRQPTATERATLARNLGINEDFPFLREPRGQIQPESWLYLIDRLFPDADELDPISPDDIILEAPWAQAHPSVAPIPEEE